MSRGSGHNTRMHTNETVSQPMHMDVDATRRGPLTVQEREHRFKQRLCMPIEDMGLLLSRKSPLPMNSKKKSQLLDHANSMKHHEPQKVIPESQQVTPEPDDKLPLKMFLPITIQSGRTTISTEALVDSGSDESLIDEKLVETFNSYLIIYGIL
ncbi:hypothetical protein BASA61_002694 [Batrachochytrium salamandrivorans]|nr:hypothetical protein BASA61_002694 [Batrachochytrium salamandrivorans]